MDCKSASFLQRLKEKSMVRKAQKMGSDVESDVMADLRIDRVLRMRDTVKNTSKFVPNCLEHIL